MNQVSLIGRLTQDVAYSQTVDGTLMTKFILAVDKGMNKEKKKQAEAAGRATADFIPCILWGKGAEILSQYTKKGDRLGITGSIDTGKYVDKDGNTRYTYDVKVQNFQFLESSHRTIPETTPDGGFFPTDADEIPF